MFAKRSSVALIAAVGVADFISVGSGVPLVANPKSKQVGSSVGLPTTLWFYLSDSEEERKKTFRDWHYGIRGKDCSKKTDPNGCTPYGAHENPDVTANLTPAKTGCDYSRDSVIGDDWEKLHGRMIDCAAKILSNTDLKLSNTQGLVLKCETWKSGEAKTCASIEGHSHDFRINPGQQAVQDKEGKVCHGPTEDGIINWLNSCDDDTNQNRFIYTIMWSDIFYNPS